MHNIAYSTQMCRTLTIYLLPALLFAGLGCAHRKQVQGEASLHKALFILRGRIDQFTLDHQRAPKSLAELLSSGYLKEMPTDPFTGRNDTWKTETVDDAFEVHSGSQAVGSDGRPYSAW